MKQIVWYQPRRSKSATEQRSIRCVLELLRRRRKVNGSKGLVVMYERSKFDGKRRT